MTYFKVENFKKFDALEVKNIGQFNLIVGDNNVGKTCLLEALLVEVDKIELPFGGNIGNTISLENLFYSLVNRRVVKAEDVLSLFDNKKIDVFSYFSKDGNDIKFNFNDKQSTIENSTQFIKIPYFVSIEKNELIETDFSEKFFLRSKADFNYPMVCFINQDFDLLSLYNRLSTKSEKDYLINTLKVVFPTIQNVEFKEDYKGISKTFIFTFEDKDEFIPLNYLGDGFKRIFYVVLKALSLKGKRLMIDEIEIGIHHSRQKDFFINLFKICKELDVQLFATTHSKECAENFVEAGKILDESIQQELRLIELYEVKNDIFSGTISGIDNIEYSVRNEPFRGENIYG
ncbi:putative ATPase [Flavobacterium columnare]|nr:putative ATPase [Flavobacterium columnare]